MTELAAQFTKRHPRGAVIHADLHQPAAGFSVTVLFGPSGCGKTTILRCLAGLEKPEDGVIRFGDEVWLDTDRRIFRTPQERGIGFLFQDYALFPHLSVADNIGYGLDAHSKTERRQRITEMLDVFGLTGLEARQPHHISGGQQQRVALARVMARRPRLLLLDEPLSALDPPLREQLRRELRRMLLDFNIPVLIVTHDRIEAISLADQVVILDAGVIRQSGSVTEVFSHPTDLAVARMVGVETVEPAHVVSVHDGLATVRIGSAELVAVAPPDIGDDAYACIRAEEVVVQKGVSGGSTSVRNRLTGRITDIHPDGPLVRIGLDCGFPLVALITRPACTELGLTIHDTVTVLLKAPAIHLMPRGASRRTSERS